MAELSDGNPRRIRNCRVSSRHQNQCVCFASAHSYPDKHGMSVTRMALAAGALFRG